MVDRRAVVLPALVADAAGPAVVWGRGDARLVVSVPGAPEVPARALTPAGAPALGPVAAVAAGRAVVAWTRISAGPGAAAGARVLVAPLDGSAPALPVPGSAGRAVALAAGGADGTLALVLQDLRRPGRALRVAVRRPDGAWEAVHGVPAGPGDPALAVTGDGTLVVIAGGGLRVRTPDGAWSAGRLPASARGDVVRGSRPVLAALAAGGVVLVWRAPEGLRAAVREGGAWGAPEDADPGAAGCAEAGPPVAAAAGDGGLLVAWQEGDALWTARRAPEGRWGAAVPLAAPVPDATWLGLAAAPDGGAVAAWAHSGRSDARGRFTEVLDASLSDPAGLGTAPAGIVPAPPPVAALSARALSGHRVLVRAAVPPGPGAAVTLAGASGASPATLLTGGGVRTALLAVPPALRDGPLRVRARAVGARTPCTIGAPVPGRR